MNYLEAKEQPMPKEFSFGFRYIEEQFIIIDVNCSLFKEPDTTRINKFGE